MREARAKFGITWLPDGRLFAVGGKISSGGSTATVEMLDTSFIGSAPSSILKGGWKYLAPMSKPRESHGVAFLDDKLVAVGGTDERTVEVFTLPTNGNALGQWSTIYPLPSPFALRALLPFENLLIGIRKPYFVTFLNEVIVFLMEMLYSSPMAWPCYVLSDGGIR